MGTRTLEDRLLDLEERVRVLESVDSYVVEDSVVEPHVVIKRDRVKRKKWQTRPGWRPPDGK